VLCSGECATALNASVQEVIRSAYGEGNGVSMVEYDEPVAISSAGDTLSNDTQLPGDKALDQLGSAADDVSMLFDAAMVALWGARSDYATFKQIRQQRRVGACVWTSSSLSAAEMFVGVACTQTQRTRHQHQCHRQA